MYVERYHNGADQSDRLRVHIVYAFNAVSDLLSQFGFCSIGSRTLDRDIFLRTDALFAE